jgi:hypothetical protein
MSPEQITDVDHGFYIDAVVQALKAAGLPVVEYEALADTHREAVIKLALPDQAQGFHTVLAWDEERGWQRGYTDARQSERGIQGLADLICDDRYLDTVAFPVTVTDAVLKQALDVPDDLNEALAAYLPAAPEPEPDPASPREIAISLMLDASRELNDIREALPEVLADLGIVLSEAEYEALIDELTELAETADITIGWSEVTSA